MINIVRSQPPPISLSTSEIRQYIDSIDAYKAEQELPEGDRKLQKPVCRVSWRSTDIFKRFEDDFFSKCYLTEQKYVSSWSMDVEHFESRSERPELAYEWSNLYPADHDANMAKPRSMPSGGYLDPCNPAHDVESAILYTVLTEDGSPFFEAVDLGDVRAVNTANLLDRLHNGHSRESRLKASELHVAIRKKYMQILERICLWRKANMDNDQQAEFDHRRVLMGLLSRKSAFTMLMRSTRAVRDLPDSFFD